MRWEKGERMSIPNKIEFKSKNDVTKAVEEFTSIMKQTAQMKAYLPKKKRKLRRWW